MGKVIKILISVISAFILAALIIPIVLVLLLSLDSFQNMAVRKAAAFASRKLETTVSIDHIDIKLFSGVVVDGFYVEDTRGDTLIYASKVSATLNGFGILRGDIALGEVHLSDVKFNLRELPEGVMNIKVIVDHLKREDRPERDTRISANNLLLENVDFTLVKNEIPDRGGSVNFADLDIRQMRLSAENITVVNDDVKLRLKNISFAEKSGFVLHSLSSRDVRVANGFTSLDRLHIITPDSDLNMDYFRMMADDWQGFGHFTDKVRLEAKLVSSRVAIRTVGYFVPSLMGKATELDNVNIDLAGPVADITGEISSLLTGDNTRINSMRFGAVGLPDIHKARFDFNISEISTDVSDIDRILSDFTGKPLDDSLKVKLANAGNVILTGHFSGSVDNFKADAAVGTARGGIDMDLVFVPAPENATGFSGNVRINDFELGKMLNSAALGNVTLSANLDGRYSREHLVANTKAQLSHLHFNGYDYSGIELDGIVNERNFDGHISSSDPNINFTFDGKLDFNTEVPAYDFTLDMQNADLHALNFNSKDSTSLVRARIVATASGASLDNLNGTVWIDRLLYRSSTDSVRTGRIRIEGRNDQYRKYLGLFSDFADAEFRSRTEYAKLSEYFRHTLASYIPSLGGREESMHEHRSATVSDINNYSLVTLNVKQANNVAGIFVPGLVLAQGTHMTFMFNPDVEKFTLALESEYLERGNNFLSNLKVTALNQGDSIALYLRADDLYAGGFYMPDFSINAGVKDNRINVATRYRDRERGTSAMLGSSIVLGYDPFTGIPQASIILTPSYLRSGERTWNVAGMGIKADSTGITIGNFIVQGEDQRLRLFGKAGRDMADSVHIQLSNFDLGPFTQITERLGYEIKGRTSGHADFVSVFKNGLMHAELSFDDVSVNGRQAPGGFFESTWDFQNERARFMLSRTDTNDTVIMGYFSPARQRYLADVKIKGLELGLLDPFFQGVLSSTAGGADVDVRITGEKNNLSINGKIEVPELVTSVDFLNVNYKLSNAELAFTDSRLTLQKGNLTDPVGNTAGMELDVDLSNFQNISYNIRILPENLLVLNTTEEINDMFYGRVFASGAATVRGDKRGVHMDITATTAGNSEFYMPLSGKQDIGEVDFITFTRPRRDFSSMDEYSRRKRMILSRNTRRQRREVAGDMSIDMVLNVLPNTDFQLLIDPQVGDIIRARGEGSLSMHINPRNDEFSMYGDYVITKGNYLFTLQDIINKKFEIEPGSSILWSGEPTDAILNISAVYKLKASLAPLASELGLSETDYARVPVECYIHLNDRLTQPDITFEIVLPGDAEMQGRLSNALSTQESMATQFFFLLATRGFYSDAGQGNIGVTGSSATAFEFFSNQLSNWISSDRFDIGFHYNPKTDFTSDEINLDFSTALFNNRVIIEAEGSYDTGNNSINKANPNASNLTGDFVAWILIDRSGSLRTKVFTRTIDTFGEYQGLQESGVGIYYKEDFNNVSDIVRNFKDRFRGRKVRKQARAEQKEEMLQEELELQLDREEAARRRELLEEAARTEGTADNIIQEN